MDINRILKHLECWLPVLVLALATGCSFWPGTQDGPPFFSRLDPDDIEDAVPRVEPKSRYGNPASYVVMGKRYYVASTSKGYVERGYASWYGTKFHKRRTSSGEPYDMFTMTAAHRTLPLPTYVRITNLENNRRAVVRVNDRGPFHPKRIIDLSYAAAVKLGVVGKGTAFVEIRAIDPSQPEQASEKARLRKVGGLVLSEPEKNREPIPSEPAKTDISAEPLPAPHQELTEGDLYLQVGAFASQERAERLKMELNAIVDRDIRIDTEQNDGYTLYKVRVGPFQDSTSADQVGDKLTEIGIDRLYIRIPPTINP
uniref:Endolytic peptidoglycan transglycosylase RlpA n=1 Tax=Candidatus Kentrum sp. FW TaxID=2126338 RepID=A0A450T9A0_9GAMM|nr:MAG: rare lipoprotein A [Candidatus Kentron sp. FW]VFJ63260.1 MAG: rare lipoprotein A [Candidatus Kentron sp. FW]